MSLIEDIQGSLFDDNPEYDDFTAKFEPKKTTDDCYTPPLVFEAVKEWACRTFDIDPAKIVYENGAVVSTGFVTSFGGDIVAMSAPDLCRAIDRAVAVTRETNPATK